MASAYRVGLLLEKMTSPDKDFRFMAINDLMKELNQGTLSLEEDSTVKVVRALLRSLCDNNGEVQNLAIKCIGTLAQPSRIAQNHLELLIDELTPYLYSNDEMIRDIGAMSMKSILHNLPATHGSPNSPVVRKLVPKLLEAVRQPNIEQSSLIDSLDILGDILLRFGDLVSDSHVEIHRALFTHLDSSRQAIRKKATTAIGYLASVVSPSLYDSIVVGLLTKLGNAKGAVVSRTFVVALTYVAKSSDSKFSEHLASVVPYLIQFLRSSDDDDLKEASLQGLEVFLYRCPSEVAAFQTDVQMVLAASLEYDPNYDYGEDEEDDESMEMDEDDEDYSDDEDMTWKVRRAAAKAIEAMVTSQCGSLLTYITNLGPILIARFKEREETVRNEILSAYIALLNQVAIVIPNISEAQVSQSDADMQTDDIITIGRNQFSSLYLSSEQVAIFKALDGQKEKLVKQIRKLLKRHSKSGPKCLELLTALVRTFPGALDDSLNDLIPNIRKILEDKSATAQGKMIVLSFVSKSFSMHDSKIFENMLTSITEIVIQAVEDPFYKVSAEGLNLCKSYVDVLKECSNSKSHVDRLFEVIKSKFMSNDTDQDVRERSIIGMCYIVAIFKKEIEPHISTILEKLTERIGRDMTCLVATKCASDLLISEVSFNETLLKKILEHAIEYLKKTSRSLRITFLGFIQNLLKMAKFNQIPQMEMSNLLGDIPKLISDSDLQITNQTLNCLSTAYHDVPQCVESHTSNVLDSVVKLIQSPLLQGAALTALMRLFSSIVKSDAANKPSFIKLLDQLTSPVYDVANLPRQAHVAISSCCSIIAETTNDLEKNRALVIKLAEQFSDRRSTDSIRLFAMSTLGELGRRCPDVFLNLADTIRPERLAMEAFNSNSEELKGAAAHALGALAVGNLQQYLPFILDQIRNHPKKQYLLLHALKEVIVCESSGETLSNELFRSAIGDVWSMLLQNAAGHEDGTRSVVAECLGRLCTFDPENILPKLKEYVSSPDPVIRSTVVSAVKYMITQEKKSVDSVLQKYIGDFLVAVKDEDLKVRRVALVVLNSAAHNKPILIRDLLPDLLPEVYQETKLRTELIKEVEMGPFKHQVDEGLDLRKCAYECMYTLLENCVDKIDITQFLAVMEVGLNDQNHDVKLLSYLTLQKIATVAPGQVLARLDKICEPLRQQLNLRPRSNAVKQELEKIEEMKKAVVRVTFMLKNRLPDVERVQQFVDMYNTIRNNKELQSITDAVVRESQRAVVYDVPMETI